MRANSNGFVVDRILKLLGKAFPVPEHYNISDAKFDELKNKNYWIDITADILCLTSFWIGIFLPGWLTPNREFLFWDLAIMFGLAVFIPSLWIVVSSITYGGKKKLSEFLIFYSNKFGIYWKNLVIFIYLPFILLGVIGFFYAYK